MKTKLAILAPLLIAFIVINAPVQILASKLSKQTNLVILGLQGTLWAGKIDQLNYSTWQLNEIAYSIDFLPLLVGNVSGELSISKGDIQGNFELTASSDSALQIERGNLEMSASQLKRFMPFPGIEVKGSVATDDLSLALKKNKLVALIGLTHWTSAALSIGNNHFKLGSYSIDWRTDEKGDIQGRIIPSNNALGLQGRVTLTAQGIFEFKGSIATDIDQKLYNSLLFFSSGPVNDKRLPLFFKKKIF